METVTTASTVYTFTYDEFGNVTAIRAGDSLLASYTYGSNNGKLTTLTYGNGKVVQYTYDELDRVSEICYNDNEGVQHKYIYTYTASGAIHSVECTESGRKYQYNYNSRGQLTGYTELTASGNAYTDLAQSFFWYDDLNRLEYTQTSFRYAVGDYVWATDPETGVTELKQVTQLFRNETNEWIHVTVNGEEITCTPNHPFYSPVKGWTSACKLRAGDVLVTLNGEYVVVEQVQHELLEMPETTYNFEVGDFHTYYVGDTEVLVHNECESVKIGQLGEQAAGISSKGKTKIFINGRNRIPDKLTDDVLTEVKNVKYICNTQQLRDFADFARSKGMKLELYVRRTTKISQTVRDAGWNIKYLW